MICLVNYQVLLPVEMGDYKTVAWLCKWVIGYVMLQQRVCFYFCCVPILNVTLWTLIAFFLTVTLVFHVINLYCLDIRETNC